MKNTGKNKYAKASLVANIGGDLPNGPRRTPPGRDPVPTDMASIAVLGMPFVISYTAVVYWVFRGKVRLGKFSY